MKIVTARMWSLIFGLLALGFGAAVVPVWAQDGPSVAIVDDGPTASWGYDPKSLQVTAGDTVTWTNTGAQPHTVTAIDTSFDSDYLQTGDTFSQTFTDPGTFQYTCTPHPWMLATVVVASAADPAPDPAMGGE